jgi:hypothetical protein
MSEKISNMSPEQKRIAIAEACGWKHYGCTGCAYSPCVCNEWIHESTDFSATRLPDYLGDLNACHEMEKTLTDDQVDSYLGALLTFTWRGCKPSGQFRDLGEWRTLHATAAQRADAFLIAKGLATL